MAAQVQEALKKYSEANIDEYVQTSSFAEELPEVSAQYLKARK